MVRPLLEAAQPRVVVEIGAKRGHLTGDLLEFCACTDAVAHVIDPAPQFDVDDWSPRHDGRFVFHRALSLHALGGITGIDAVLIDGDHNWYTVFHELKLLEFGAQREGRDFPLVVLHDVDWPHGRRDLYYAIDTIPATHRQPHARGRARLGEARLFPDETGRCRALHEHGERNGVLTAVEDFVAQAAHPLKLNTVSGFNGLGILTVGGRPAPDALEAELARLRSVRFLADRCGELESSRIESIWRRREVENELRKSTAARRRLRDRAARNRAVARSAILEAKRARKEHRQESKQLKRELERQRAASTRRRIAAALRWPLRR